MSRIANYNVTINVTAHREGYYLFRTLQSVRAMCIAANSENLTTLIQINLDNTDPLTKKIADEFMNTNKNCIVFINQFGDLSASRNFLIEKTTSKYTLFVDGDDLFTENFICVAYKAAQQFDRPCVVSAEDIVKFDKSVDPYIFQTESTVDSPGIKSALFEMNLYISQNFVSTEIYKKCKYEPNMGNYGFEDWHWNTKVVSEGYEYLVAKDTVFFYRQKPADKSLLKKNINNNTVVRPTQLFTPDTFIKLHHDEYIPTVTVEVVKNAKDLLLEKLTNVLPRTSFAYRLIRKSYRLSVGKMTQLNDKRETNHKHTARLSSISTIKEDLWNKMNAIEPVIRLDDNLKGQLEVGLYAHEHTLATTYRLFCEKYGKDGFTDIIFVPWIHRGGADLAMLDLARELSKKRGRVLIVTTNGIDSQWGDKAKNIPGVVFLQSHDSIFKNLDHVNIKIFFLRLIQNWKISSMTIMNSAIGFELVERFGYAIRDTGCQIIVHNYAFPVSQGLVIDAFPSFTSSLDQVHMIVTDSNYHRNVIHNTYGVDLGKIIEIPLMINADLQRKTSLPTKRVLFANRIAREKQPQVAIETARILKDRGVSLDIYGSTDEHFCKEIHFEQLVSNAPNVEFRGLFGASEELNFNDYDICFMPSLYEGTPRILLESIDAGLYVVCSGVGGMPESIVSEFSGVVLAADSKPEDYANAINSYYNTEKLQNLDKRRKANESVMNKHSDKNYVKLVDSVYHLNKESIHD